MIFGSCLTARPAADAVALAALFDSEKLVAVIVSVTECPEIRIRVVRVSAAHYRLDPGPQFGPVACSDHEPGNDSVEQDDLDCLIVDESSDGAGLDRRVASATPNLAVRANPRFEPTWLGPHLAFHRVIFSPG